MLVRVRTKAGGSSLPAVGRETVNVQRNLDWSFRWNDRKTRYSPNSYSTLDAAPLLLCTAYPQKYCYVVGQSVIEYALSGKKWYDQERRRKNSGISGLLQRHAVCIARFRIRRNTPREGRR